MNRSIARENAPWEPPRGRPGAELTVTQTHSSDCSPNAQGEAAPTVDPALLAALERCEWVERGEPVVLLGDSGTGKSHLLIGLGLAACQRGLRVRYTTAAQLVNELAEVSDERVLSRLVARYGRLDLLCLDELGYLQLDRRGAELRC